MSAKQKDRQRGVCETMDYDYDVNESSHASSTDPTNTNQLKYKWAAVALEVIQSILVILTTHILAILEFLLLVLPNPCQFFRQTWSTIWGQMTIELVTTTEKQCSVPATGNYCGMDLPALRLNSVTMEGYIRDCAAVAEDDRDQGFASASDLPSCNSNSSDGEAEGDSGPHVFSGDEEELNPKQNAINNLPQDTHFRRDSSGSSDDGISDEDKTAEITQKLISQVELMFSDEHLAKDGFLLKHVRRRSDGYVSLKLVAGLRKVKQISRDFPTILSALRLSLKLDVNLDGTKVRRMEPLTPYLKSLPISGGKDKEPTTAVSNKPRPSADLSQDEMLNRVSTRHGGNINQTSNGYHRKISRNSSNASTGSSNCSRHGSFSQQYHAGTSPADLFYRNVHVLAGEESTPQVNRRRGGSLPIPMNGNANANHHYHAGGPPPAYYNYQRNSMYLSPNSSPPNGNEIPQRPKSNSYCEGTPNKNLSLATSPNGMSVWLQRRMASTRSSEGNIELNGVLRQPRGPDGTKGFASNQNQAQRCV